MNFADKLMRGDYIPDGNVKQYNRCLSLIGETYMNVVLNLMGETKETIILDDAAIMALKANISGYYCVVDECISDEVRAYIFYRGDLCASKSYSPNTFFIDIPIWFNKHLLTNNVGQSFNDIEQQIEMYPEDKEAALRFFKWGVAERVLMRENLSISDRVYMSATAKYRLNWSASIGPIPPTEVRELNSEESLIITEIAKILNKLEYQSNH